MRIKSLITAVVSSVLLLQTGCSIIMVSSHPRSRPPELLTPGVEQKWVDRKFGYPLATGMSADGMAYIEQVQFVDGISVGNRIVRIICHAALDWFTLFIWEIAGTTIEYTRDYPTYTYYLVYDQNNRLVEAISGDSNEGRRLSKLPWTSPPIPNLTVNRNYNATRMSLGAREKAQADQKAKLQKSTQEATP